MEGHEKYDKEKLIATLRSIDCIKQYSPAFIEKIQKAQKNFEKGVAKN